MPGDTVHKILDTGPDINSIDFFLLAVDKKIFLANNDEDFFLTKMIKFLIGKTHTQRISIDMGFCMHYIETNKAHETFN